MNVYAAAAPSSRTIAFADALPRTFGPNLRVLPAILKAQAERYGALPLAVFGHRVWTYADGPVIAARAGALLASAGVKHGDRIAIFCSNRLEFLALFLGCGWTGAALVPLNTALRGAQLRHALINSDVKLMIVEAKFASAFDDLGDALAGVEILWTIGGPATSRTGGREALALPLFPEPIPPATVRPGDTMAILYTSGTTGPAKGVCCPQAQFFWWGVNTARGLGLREGEVLMTTLPLFHTNALNCFWQALLTGSTFALEPRFSATEYWRAAARRKATVGYLLGAMAAILLSRAPDEADRAHNMRIALGGGVPGRFHQPFLDRFGVPMLDAYGSTETNFVFSGALPAREPGGMGFLCPGFSARIVDDDDNEIAPGEAGELTLRADAPFAFATGYFGMPDKTVEAWRNLWFHTGDRVRREADGNFRFLDRIKDAIRRRGENISSWEVEQTLLAHPKVASCAVYAAPSEFGEDEVMAAIVVEPGERIDPLELTNFCAQRLAYFAVPRYLDFVAELPLTENGKIRKTTLRQAGITASAWDREAAGHKLRRPG